MPINTRKDKKGYYVQWGNHGKKYYFDHKSYDSYETAHKKAIKQSVAAMYHGYKYHKK
jgi:hypothetical protein